MNEVMVSPATYWEIAIKVSLKKLELVAEYDEVMKQGIVGNDFHAVSYTHLRAHETVLDLVCRLLLEKKTQHIYSHGH